jgi:methionyl-tRNA formyltransferase
MTRAVVFGYHDVGVRCLSVLLAHGVEVPLVVTHEDDPGENVWFGSVARFAREHDIEVITPANPNAPEVVERIRDLAPDFAFSFYYRRMLGRDLLDIPRLGALNMHGSLLPKYRGRAPVNWAVLKGERETGATLHYMTEKPDQGAIVARQAVPILPDDTALDVFRKVTCAAELALHSCLPALIGGSAPAVPQDLASGSYFSGRKPEDGRIDWGGSAADVHNLVRAVAPPYPGACTTLSGVTVKVLRSRLLDPAVRHPSAPVLEVRGSHVDAVCGGGGAVRLLELECEGKRIDAAEFARRFGPAVVPDRPDSP